MRRLLAALFLASAVACGDSTTEPTTTSVVGTYTLRTVNGSQLPFVVQADNPKLELLGDVLIVNAGGTFSQTTTLRMTTGTVVSTDAISDAGTYALNGTAATFRFNSDGSTATATISGGTLTFADSEFSSVYTK